MTTPCSSATCYDHTVSSPWERSATHARDHAVGRLHRQSSADMGKHLDEGPLATGPQTTKMRGRMSIRIVGTPPKVSSSTSCLFSLAPDPRTRLTQPATCCRTMDRPVRKKTVRLHNAGWQVGPGRCCQIVQMKEGKGKDRGTGIQCELRSHVTRKRICTIHTNAWVRLSACSRLENRGCQSASIHTW